MQRDKPSEELQSLFNEGHAIEDIARKKYFPNGMNIKPKSPLQWPKVIEMTKNLLLNGQERLYEAALQHKGVMCAFDVLDNHGEQQISIYEIKRSPKVKEVFLYDLALQYWVANEAGYQVEEICLVQPVEESEGEFKVSDFTEHVIAMQAEVSERIEQQFNLLLRKQIPNIKMGEQCLLPYRCSFIGYCSKDGMAS